MRIKRQRSSFIPSSSQFLMQNKKSLLPVSYEKIEQYKNQLLKSTRASSFKRLNKFSKINPDNNYIKNLKKLCQNESIVNETKINSLISSGKFLRQEKLNDKNPQTYRKTFTSSFQRSSSKRSLQNCRPSTQLKEHRNFEVKLNLLKNLQQDEKQKKQVKIKEQIENWEQDRINININKERLKNSRYCQSASSSKRFFSYNQNHKNRKQQKGAFDNTVTIFNDKNNKEYLKKGTAIDRSLLLNLLKSKFAQNKIKNALVFQSYSECFNYSNFSSNQLLLEYMKKQIPSCLRDIIGPEQMIKMSRILTGVNLKAVNLNHKIQQHIRLRENKKQITKNEEEDDHQTLQSIKRW